jgi:hypothetical protein
MDEVASHLISKARKNHLSQELPKITTAARAGNVQGRAKTTFIECSASNQGLR